VTGRRLGSSRDDILGSIAAGVIFIGAAIAGLRLVIVITGLGGLAVLCAGDTWPLPRFVPCVQSRCRRPKARKDSNLSVTRRHFLVPTGSPPPTCDPYDRSTTALTLQTSPSCGHSTITDESSSTVRPGTKPLGGDAAAYSTAVGRRPRDRLSFGPHPDARVPWPLSSCLSAPKPRARKRNAGRHGWRAC
jgi:hypothetical protein